MPESCLKYCVLPDLSRYLEGQTVKILMKFRCWMVLGCIGIAEVRVQPRLRAVQMFDPL